MHAIFAFLATLSAAFFAGAALYINVVEHAARMGLDVASATAQWAPSYQRADLAPGAARDQSSRSTDAASGGESDPVESESSRALVRPTGSRLIRRHLNNHRPP